MLAITIISTIIIGILMIIFTAAISTESDKLVIKIAGYAMFLLPLIFILITLWILYLR